MPRKAVGALLVLALLAALAVAGARIWMEQSAGGRISASLDTLEPADAGLVLGSSMLLRNGYGNPYFTNRIAAAAALFASGKVKYLIVSGNQAGGGYDEPTDMRNVLVAAGVPENRIYRDYAGFRTLDSVLRAKAIFGQDRVILVSQHFHLVRALFLAAEHGLDFEGFEAEDVPLRYGVTTQIREALARVWALIDIVDRRAAHFGGQPVRLGIDPPT
jgi:SanA protein